MSSPNLGRALGSFTTQIGEVPKNLLMEYYPLWIWALGLSWIIKIQYGNPCFANTN
jgi:hypothetical protein